MDTVDLYSNQLLPMPHPHGGVASPTHHSPLPPLTSALTMTSSNTSHGNIIIFIFSEERVKKDNLSIFKGGL